MFVFAFLCKNIAYEKKHFSYLWHWYLLTSSEQMHRKPAAPVMPKTLHEAARWGMHQTSKGLSLSTFQFLQSTKPEISWFIRIENVAQFFSQQSKNFYWIFKMHRTANGLKTFQISMNILEVFFEYMLILYHNLMSLRIW